MTNLSPFLIYVFVTTFTPGPNNIISMSNGMRFGYRNILRFLGGIFSGFFIVMALCGLLNIALVNLLPQLKTGLKFLGAAYMLYLAFHTYIFQTRSGYRAGKWAELFKAGFTMQFINVKVILYGITIFSTFIVTEHQNPLITTGFALLLAAVGLISTSCWAVGGNLFRRFLHKYNLVFNLSMGALLIYTAIASLL